jgi:hypothetical protein
MYSFWPTISVSCCNVKSDRSDLPHLDWGDFKPALSGEFHTCADSQELGTACGERQSRATRRRHGETNRADLFIASLMLL